ncbi:MAG: B12-binding domain-containing radical SAM protein [Bacillota bacterium]
MKVLLARTKPVNIFAGLKAACFEPLELEYLAAAINQMGFHYQIYDGMIEKREFQEVLEDYSPHVVALTGYTIHVNQIRDYARRVKKLNQSIKVVVGGIHAELNWDDFYTENIDAVVFANPFAAFGEIIQRLATGQGISNIHNICYRENDRWVKNSETTFQPDELPFPDRRHLHLNAGKFRYFGKEECAIVKTAWGCPFNCSFCYCCRLNGGNYSPRCLEKVVKEIETITQKKVFIIDDDFLVSRERIISFCSLIERAGICKDFSIYGRADLICSNRDLLPLLKKAGVSEIIVGLEAVDNQALKSFNKQVTIGVNDQAVRYLHEAGICCTGLFIVSEDFGVKDFRQLSKKVNELRLDLCMFSIFTPLKGVPGYEQYQSRLIIPQDNYERADFLHLNVPCTKLSQIRFYFEFYLLYVKAYLTHSRFWRNLKPLVKSLGHLIYYEIKKKLRR